MFLNIYLIKQNLINKEKELGLDLGPLDYTAAAWDVPQDTTSIQDAMNSDEDSYYT